MSTTLRQGSRRREGKPERGSSDHSRAQGRMTEFGGKSWRGNGTPDADNAAVLANVASFDEAKHNYYRQFQRNPSRTLFVRREVIPKGCELVPAEMAIGREHGAREGPKGISRPGETGGCGERRRRGNECDLSMER